MKSKPKSISGLRITVSLSRQDHDALSALAERFDVSLSWLTRQALSHFLESHAKGDLQLPLQLETKGRSPHG